MTKLEELTAMMVNEIEQFQTTVKKLEKIQKGKIELDLKELRTLMTEHQTNLKKATAHNERWVDLSKSTLKKAQIFFNRGMIMVFVSFVLNFLTAVFFLLVKMGLIL